MRSDAIEIELPEDKPAWEWVRGRALQKMSPRFSHGKLQFEFARALTEWAGDRGAVAVEWRFRFAPPGEVRRPLVPDVAYLSREKFAPLRDRDLDYPPMAPDIAVEILSPGDRSVDVDAKRRDYLAAGGTLVIVVDPGTRTVRTYASDANERTFDANDTLVANAFPDLAIGLAPIFASIEPLR
jgi:Uma2 family endonuclease